MELAKLSAFAFEFGISDFYYESLADNPKKYTLMGLVDKWGRQKLSYGYLREVTLLVRGGYTVANSSSKLLADRAIALSTWRILMRRWS